MARQSVLDRIKAAKALKAEGVRIPLGGDYHELEAEIFGVPRDTTGPAFERCMERIRRQANGGAGIPLKKWNDPRQSAEKLEAINEARRRIAGEMLLGRVWGPPAGEFLATKPAAGEEQIERRRRMVELAAEERAELLAYADFVDEINDSWVELLRGTYEDREEAEGNSGAGSAARSRNQIDVESEPSASETKAKKAS